MPTLLRPDSAFYRAWSAAADLVIINVLTLLACLPLLTAGAALTACARVTMEMARDEDTYVVRAWWRSLRTNLRQSLAWWVPVLALTVLAVWENRVLADGRGSSSVGEVSSSALGALTGLIMAGALLVVGMFVWLVPLVAFFEAPVARHIANAARLAVGRLGETAACLLIVALPAAIAGLLPASRTAVGIFMALIGVAFGGYLMALVQRRVIDRLRDAVS